MIRYSYVKHITPPAPFVYVSVRCLATNEAIADAPAQIDTAADRTVLPDSLVRSLGLVEDGRLLFQGFAGEVIELPVRAGHGLESRRCRRRHLQYRRLPL